MRLVGCALRGCVVVLLVAAVVLLVGSQVLVSRPSSGAASVVSVGRPFGPGWDGLSARLVDLRIPLEGGAEHIHVRLVVMSGGASVVVPGGIGISASQRVIAPLHTHDESGTVHIEAATVYPFTLGQFFAVWGVRLAGGQVTVNGTAEADAGAYVLRDRDVVVVGFQVGPSAFP